MLKRLRLLCAPLALFFLGIAGRLVQQKKVRPPQENTDDAR